MDFLNQIVIPKLWGEGTVTRYDHTGFYVTFGNDERRFGYPDSFAEFLRFKDPQLQNMTEQLLQEKESEKAKALKVRQPSPTAPQAYATPAKKAKPRVEKPNIVFKCNYCDGGSNKYHIGYMGACSDDMIRYNILEAQHSWCSDPDCACSQYLYGEITGGHTQNQKVGLLP